MKRILFLGLALFALPSAAIAQCAVLKGDDFHYCRAKYEGKGSECGSINDTALKRRCLAEVRGDVTECASIIDDRQRALCRARFGK